MSKKALRDINTIDRSDAMKRRFMRYVDVQGPDDCWMWLGGQTKKGRTNSYGVFTPFSSAERRDGRGGLSATAHRVSHVLFCGPIPDGLDVLHDCDQPLYVNPRHVGRTGTHQQNMRECRDCGRNGNTILTPKDVEMIRWIAASFPSLTMADFGKLFGVTKSNVSQLRRAGRWPGVPMPDRDNSTQRLRDRLPG